MSEKWKSRSLAFALFVFISSSYLVHEAKIDSETYGTIVMWTMIGYGAKRTSENLNAG